MKRDFFGFHFALQTFLSGNNSSAASISQLSTVNLLGVNKRSFSRNTSGSYHHRYLVSSKLFLKRGGNAADGDLTNSDIKLPFREHGYRCTPFSWDELHQIIVQEQDLAKLSRSVDQEQEYQKSLLQLKREWKSVKDYILHSKFQLPKEMDDDVQKYYVAETTIDRIHEPILRVVPNDFPYHCAPGIEHWVLWKLGKESCITKEEIEFAQNVVQTEYSDVNENMICWENPPGLKSMPEIDHVHILFRQSKSGD
jgi:hypothetical protein